MRYTVANGTSVNRYRGADLHETQLVLGYHPIDDAWASEGDRATR